MLKEPKTQKAPKKATARSSPQQSGPTPYKDLGLRPNARRADINAAYVNKMLRIIIDPDNPDSPGHRELSAISDAKAVLQTPHLRRALDLCLRKIQGDRRIRPFQILGMPEGATDDQVNRAYMEQKLYWSGYDRYIETVMGAMREARDHMCKENKAAKTGGSQAAGVSKPNDKKKEQLIKDAADSAKAALPPAPSAS